MSRYVNRSQMTALFVSAAMAAALAFPVRVGAADSPRDRYSRPNISSRNRPTTSPYLNLLRNSPGSSGFASDYFLRLRPEQQWRNDNAQFERSIQNLQQQLSRQQPSQQRSPNSTIGPTGHGTMFFNHSHYYPSGR